MRLSVADDFGSIEDLRYAWIEACGWGLLGFLVLSSLGGLLLSQGFLKRVDAIRRTADAIICGDLDRASLCAAQKTISTSSLTPSIK